MQRKLFLFALLVSYSLPARAADDEAKKKAEGARLALIMNFEKCTDLKCLEPMIDGANGATGTPESKALAKSVLDDVCKRKADLCAKIPENIAAREKAQKEEQAKMLAAQEELKSKLKPSTAAKEPLKPASELEGKKPITKEDNVPPPAPPTDNKKAPAVKGDAKKGEATPAPAGQDKK